VPPALAPSTSPVPCPRPLKPRHRRTGKYTEHVFVNPPPTTIIPPSPTGFYTRLIIPSLHPSTRAHAQPSRPHLALSLCAVLFVDAEAMCPCVVATHETVQGWKETRGQRRKEREDLRCGDYLNNYHRFLIDGNRIMDLKHPILVLDKVSKAIFDTSAYILVNLPFIIRLPLVQRVISQLLRRIRQNTGSPLKSLSDKR
jgi:hypothetical protein